MRKSFVAFVFLAVCTFLPAQQVLNNAAVIKLVKAGLSDDLIVSTIGTQAGSFDTSTDGLIALKGAGVSDRVVAAMVTKAAASKNTDPSPAPSISASVQTPSSGNDVSAPTPSSVTKEGTESPEEGTASGSRPITAGARIVIAPMGGFETYFAAAVREKKVPVVLTLSKESAQYFVVSTRTEWQGFVYGSGGGANWSGAGGSANFGSAGSSTRGLEASIMVIDAKTKDVVWAYEVHKNSHGALLIGTHAARGQQSLAEACAKHLREYIEKGK